MSGTGKLPVNNVYKGQRKVMFTGAVIGALAGLAGIALYYFNGWGT